MKYRSTRGGDAGLSFEQALFSGLSPDGGLYIPDTIPAVSLETLRRWSSLSFAALAAEIFRLYIDASEIPDADLLDITTRSYAAFDTDLVTPLVKLPSTRPDNADPEWDRLYLLELFHGPTFAFKDVALQTLGNFFEYFLVRNAQRTAAGAQGLTTKITVVGATSGDTGSAAIYGLRGKKNVELFMLHPEGRISPVQYQQMATVTDANIHNISITGTFDDCQEVVKGLFLDPEFRQQYALAAVNSINWARILAQMTYYFSAFFQLLRLHNIAGDQLTAESLAPLQFVVPTGNFGDILAGYYAVRMGLPAAQLVVATNTNDILHRFFQTGVYAKKAPGAADAQVKHTLSPAMDILVSSNFERLLWYLLRGDGRAAASSTAGGETDTERDARASATLAELMASLRETGAFTVPEGVLARARELFDSCAINNARTSQTIRTYYHAGAQPGVGHMILDPHTAVGVAAAHDSVQSAILDAKDAQVDTMTDAEAAPRAVMTTVCLSTASPGKFADAVCDAVNSD
ncbi:hypothetical protein CXG81DRAFT_1189, partial [Caulochytrium protostelioides]